MQPLKIGITEKKMNTYTVKKIRLPCGKETNQIAEIWGFMLDHGVEMADSLFYFVNTGIQQKYQCSEYHLQVMSKPVKKFPAPTNHPNMVFRHEKVLISNTGILTFGMPEGVWPRPVEYAGDKLYVGVSSFGATRQPYIYDLCLWVEYEKVSPEEWVEIRDRYRGE